MSGRLNGRVLPSGVDSQIIQPDGFTELVARYGPELGPELDGSEQVYVSNTGIRRVNDPQMAVLVAAGLAVVGALVSTVRGKPGEQAGPELQRPAKAKEEH